MVARKGQRGNRGTTGMRLASPAIEGNRGHRKPKQAAAPQSTKLPPAPTRLTREEAEVWKTLKAVAYGVTSAPHVAEAYCRAVVVERRLAKDLSTARALREWRGIAELSRKMFGELSRFQPPAAAVREADPMALLLDAYDTNEHAGLEP
jgi:hypothetical protein